MTTCITVGRVLYQNTSNHLLTYGVCGAFLMHAGVHWDTYAPRLGLSESFDPASIHV